MPTTLSTHRIDTSCSNIWSDGRADNTSSTTTASFSPHGLLPGRASKHIDSSNISVATNTESRFRVPYDMKSRYRVPDEMAGRDCVSSAFKSSDTSPHYAKAISEEDIPLAELASRTLNCAGHSTTHQTQSAENFLEVCAHRSLLPAPSNPQILNDSAQRSTPHSNLSIATNPIERLITGRGNKRRRIEELEQKVQMYETIIEALNNPYLKI